MSARLTLLLGRANTGKSHRIRLALKAHQQVGERAVLIVPEQYTFEAERSLSAALGGIMGVQVLSFERLNQRILTLHGLTRPFLSPQGHLMVIRRAVQTRGGALTAFARAADKPGFAEQMQELFSDCKRAGMTPADLKNVAEKLPAHTPLRDKLTDAALLYGETEAFLSERYLTVDDGANAALELLPASFIAGLPVYIDGIDRPSGQLFRCLNGLLTWAKSVTVALELDPSEGPDGALFAPQRGVYEHLLAGAEERNCPVQVIPLTEQADNRTAAMAHLERNLFAYPARIYQEAAPEITIFGASDRTAEAEALADGILRLARRGLRYREMAVIVSDPAAYLPLLTRVFARRGIPAFVDRKRPVTGHGGVEAALAALCAVAGEYRAADILRLVKTGYVGVSREDGEDLELYLLKTGLTGGALLKPFARGEVPPRAERARAIVTEPLRRLQESLHGPTVSEKVRALYGYLVEIKLEEQLRARTQELLDQGRIPLMEEHAQVWNALMGALSQLDAILGDVAAGRALFLQLFTEGLGGWELGVIPGTSDQVLLGDVIRTRSRAVRALFVAGVNEDLLPALRGDDGLIDDGELAAMAAVGAKVWDDTQKRRQYDRLDLYAAISKAREQVFFSYCFSAEGGELAPSPLIDRIRKLFPLCRSYTDFEEGDELPLSPQTGLRLLAEDVRALYADGVAAPRLPALLDWYLSKPEYAPRVRRMLSAGRLRNSLPALGRRAMEALYGGRITMSASRLEQFSACPFKHFVRYSLSAQDRQEYTERAVDLGSLYHAALDLFVKAVIKRKLPWETLTEETVYPLLDELMRELLPQHNGGIFLTNPRLKAVLSLEIDAIRLSAMAVVRQVQAGQFRPLGSEVRFGEGQAFPPIPLQLEDGATALLSGVIDRLDGAPLAGGEALRVVDYKTGGREFDFSGVIHGLTLQLPLYLQAALGGGGEPLPGGLYYMPLRISAPEEEEDPAQAAAEAFRLRGLTLRDSRVILASDRGIDGPSDILKGVKPDGEDGFTGTVCTQEQMGQLLARAKKAAQTAFAGMLNGEIAVEPVERACTWCDYRSVCRFDPTVPGSNTRKYKKISMADFFAMMGGQGHAMDE